MQKIKEGSREEYEHQVSELRKQIDAAHEKSKDSLLTMEISRSQLVKDDKLSMVYNLRLGLSKKEKASELNPFLHPG
jgi:hypothetical protein